MTWLLHQHVVLLALLAGLFTWGCTIVGSAIVFFFKHISRKLLDIMMGFAAGVMIAASFWSLLDPSLAYASQNGYGKWSWFPAAAGFLLGGVALRLIDAVVPHLHLGNDISKAEGIQPRKKKLSKTALLFLAITIHNFPEGLAVGVTFGALAGGNMTLAGLMGAIGLAIGIGLQNVPEGAALSIPIRADGKSRLKALLLGIDVGNCRAHWCCYGGCSCHVDDGNHPLRFGLCGWCHDFCGNGGIDPRISDQW